MGFFATGFATDFATGFATGFRIAGFGAAVDLTVLLTAISLSAFLGFAG